MSRSKLAPHRNAIKDALDAGMSINKLAATCGCRRQTITEFIDRWIPEHAKPERLARRVARLRAENMTAEQLERKRASNRTENMPPDRLERKRAADATYRHSLAGVMARHRREERKADERIEHQSKEDR